MDPVQKMYLRTKKFSKKDRVVATENEEGIAGKFNIKKRIR